MPAAAAPRDVSVAGKIRDLRQLVGDHAVAAAARRLVLAAPFVLVAKPVLEHSWHHEPHDGRIHTAGLAFGFIVGVVLPQPGIKRRGHLRAGGRGHGAGFQLDPPFVPSAQQAGVGAHGERRHVEIHDRPSVPLAHRDEGIGDLLLNHALAKRVQ